MDESNSLMERWRITKNDIKGGGGSTTSYEELQRQPGPPEREGGIRKKRRKRKLWGQAGEVISKNKGGYHSLLDETASARQSAG